MQPKIFKLTVDCFDEIFDYISLQDLCSFGQTCKVMQKVAGEYFKQNYKSASIHSGDDCICISYSDNLAGNSTIETTIFNPFITHLSYGLSYPHNNIDALSYIQVHSDEFVSLKEITIYFNIIDSEKIEYLQKILPQIEVIRLRRCEYGGNLYEILLKHCPNLREIYVNDDTRTVPIVNVYGNAWLLQEYPSLRTVELTTRNPFKINELSEFLAKNLNIETLSVCTGYLRENREELLECPLKLETFKIRELFEHFHGSFDLLNQLHERGFYQHLHFDARNDRECTLNEFDFQELASLRALTGIFVIDYSKDCGLSRLTNLKEVTLLNDFASDLDTIAKSLVNLRSISLDGVLFEDLLHFIRNSVKLESIKVRFCNDQCAINLETLNEERKKLTKACKVMIFVTADIFLTTKWATKNGDLNLSLVELRRNDS